MHKTFLETGKTVLIQTRNKLTQSRLRVLELLWNAKTPVSPYDIQKLDPELDVVSVYRAFELFESLWLIHKVWSLGGYVTCHLDHCDSHCCHEFQVCKSCKSFTEVHGHHKHNGWSEKFMLQQHISEQLGLCENCSK